MSYKTGARIPGITPSSSPLITLIGDTILERFQTMESKYRKFLTRKDVIDFLSLENARAIGICSAGSDTDASLIKECREFFEFFMSEYSRDRSLMRNIRTRWNGEIPYILAIGMQAAMEAASFPNNQEVRLSEQEVILRDCLVNYIFSFNTRRTISFCFDGPNGRTITEQLHFRTGLSPEREKDAMEAAAEWIGYALAYAPGGITLRIHGMGRNGKDLLSSYRTEKGLIIPLPAEVCRWAQEMMPDGSRRADPTVEYRTPTIFS